MTAQHGMFRSGHGLVHRQSPRREPTDGSLAADGALTDATEVTEVAEVQLVGQNFDEFYADHYVRVLGLAYALCGDRGAAEELAQDAFVDAYRRWETVGSYNDPGQWVRRVVANRAVSRWRRITRDATLLRRLRTRTAPTMSPIDESADGFWALVRKLPARQAQIVVLRYHDDRPIAEIAEMLGCGENTVKANLFKARQKLAEALSIPVTGEAVLERATIERDGRS